MRNNCARILCYADNTVLMAETKNDLQLTLFQRTVNRYNLEISIEKMKIIVMFKKSMM